MIRTVHGRGYQVVAPVQDDRVQDDEVRGDEGAGGVTGVTGPADASVFALAAARLIGRRRELQPERVRGSRPGRPALPPA